MTAAELNALAERVEGMTAPTRSIFLEAFAACYPKPPDFELVWRDEKPKQPIYHAWANRWVTFRKLIDAEAWEQAAILLVPDGFTWSWTNKAGEEGPFAECWGEPSGTFRHRDSFAASPALALTAAALRALATKGE